MLQVIARKTYEASVMTEDAFVSASCGAERTAIGERARIYAV